MHMNRENKLPIYHSTPCIHAGIQTFAVDFYYIFCSLKIVLANHVYIMMPCKRKCVGLFISHTVHEQTDAALC